MTEEQVQQNVEEVTEEAVDTPEVTEPTFTQAEVEKMMAERVAREKKATEKAVEEAKRLATMNEDERKAHELESLKQELEQLRQKETYYGLSQEASNMLSKHSIQADEATLKFVVKGTAEETQEAVNAFVGLINAKVEQGVKQALSGTTPKVNVAQNQGVSKADFDKMTYKERVAFKNEQPELYNQFIKGE